MAYLHTILSLPLSQSLSPPHSYHFAPSSSPFSQSSLYLTRLNLPVPPFCSVHPILHFLFFSHLPLFLPRGNRPQSSPLRLVSLSSRIPLLLPLLSHLHPLPVPRSQQEHGSTHIRHPIPSSSSLHITRATSPTNNELAINQQHHFSLRGSSPTATSNRRQAPGTYRHPQPPSDSLPLRIPDGLRTGCSRECSPRS